MSCASWATPQSTTQSADYAYTVLESEVRIKAIAEGYDPTIGIVHEGRDGSSNFIFDLLEPSGPKADWAVLDLSKRRSSIRRTSPFHGDGVVRLNQNSRDMS